MRDILSATEKIGRITEDNIHAFKGDIEKLHELDFSDFIERNYDQSAIIFQIKAGNDWRGLAEDMNNDITHKLYKAERRFYFDDHGNKVLMLFNVFEGSDVRYEVEKLKEFMEALLEFAEEEEEKEKIKEKRRMEELERKEQELVKINSYLED